ncbi:hypothetical protein HPY42_01810 [Coprothermobacteraceae bacterium]|nr:hypothetical protein [Coprothermobacteraceae bacterium]
MDRASVQQLSAFFELPHMQQLDLALTVEDGFAELISQLLGATVLMADEPNSGSQQTIPAAEIASSQVIHVDHCKDVLVSLHSQGNDDYKSARRANEAPSVENAPVAVVSYAPMVFALESQSSEVVPSSVETPAVLPAVREVDGIALDNTVEMVFSAPVTPQPDVRRGEPTCQGTVDLGESVAAVAQSLSPSESSESVRVNVAKDATRTFALNYSALRDKENPTAIELQELDSTREDSEVIVPESRQASSNVPTQDSKLEDNAGAPDFSIGTRSSYQATARWVESQAPADMPSRASSAETSPLASKEHVHMSWRNDSHRPTPTMSWQSNNFEEVVDVEPDYARLETDRALTTRYRAAFENEQRQHQPLESVQLDSIQGKYETPLNVPMANAAEVTEKPHVERSMNFGDAELNVNTRNRVPVRSGQQGASVQTFVESGKTKDHDPVKPLESTEGSIGFRKPEQAPLEGSKVMPVQKPMEGPLGEPKSTDETNKASEPGRLTVEGHLSDPTHAGRQANADPVHPADVGNVSTKQEAAAAIKHELHGEFKGREWFLSQGSQMRIHELPVKFGIEIRNGQLMLHITPDSQQQYGRLKQHEAYIKHRLKTNGYAFDAVEVVTPTDIDRQASSYLYDIRV